LIPELILEKKLEGIKTKGFFIDIGTEKNLCKAKEKLNWKPKISFEQLVNEMISKDFESAKLLLK